MVLLSRGYKIKIILDEWSEAQSSAESWPFDIVIDVLTGHGLFNNLFDAEGSISGGVEIFGSGMNGSPLLPPLVNLIDLNRRLCTTLFLSTSLILTICPNEGTTLMLMLLNLVNDYPSSEIEFWNDIRVDIWLYSWIKFYLEWTSKLSQRAHHQLLNQLFLIWFIYVFTI